MHDGAGSLKPQFDDGGTKMTGLDGIVQQGSPTNIFSGTIKGKRENTSHVQNRLH